mgnify:CR=1 FL=1
MKTKVLMLVVVMFTAIITVNAQFQRRTVEERVKMVHSKIDSAFKFDTQKMANIDSGKRRNEKWRRTRPASHA